MKHLIGAIACVMFAASLFAQDKEVSPVTTFQELKDQIRPGDPIRIRRPATARYGDMRRLEEGRLKEISQDGSTLVVTGDEGEKTLLESDVERIELGSPYTRKFALEGALIGAAAGFGAMAALVVASCEQPDCRGADYAVIYGAAIGAPLGALLGFGAGKSIKRQSTRWETVYDANRRVQLGFFPIVGAQRTGAGLWISF